jgi:CRISPR-associated protein Csb2
VFALSVTYLNGRVYSATFEDGDEKLEPEWPPHPSRLFSALVAAWGEGGAEEELRPALEWLEEQPAPTIYAGSHSVRKLVQAFVPVNDSKTLPEDRPRKGRTFPSASLSDPGVYFVWEAEPSRDIAAALDRILRRTSSLGHSSSLVAVEIVDQIPLAGLTVWHPQAAQGVRMRIAYPGRLRELEGRHERFEKDPVKTNRPSAGRTARYATVTEKPRVAAQGIFDEMIVLRRDAGPRGSLRSTLSLLAALRGAIQKLAPDPVPEYLSGHAPQSTPENPIPSERPHIALAPLPFIGAPHATGDILGLAVLLPKTLIAPERSQCWKVVGSVSELRMPWGRWTVSLADAEERRRSLEAATWTGPRAVWSTVTPFVFDRFPKDPFGEEAEEVVRVAFHRIGVPAPCEIDLHYNPWHLGVPKAALFPAAPARPGKPQRYHCHMRVRFEEPVAGPMAVGAGRYYGYGFLAPLDESGGRQ